MLVLKVTDIRGVTFEDARPTLERVLRPRKERERGQELRELLLARVSASVDTSVIDTIWSSLVYATEGRPLFTPEEDSLIVVRWEGTPQSAQEGIQVTPGSAHLRRFIDFMVSAGAREVMEDSTALWRQVEDMILIEHLIPSYFAELGYDQAPEFHREAGRVSPRTRGHQAQARGGGHLHRGDRGGPQRLLGREPG